MTNLEMVLHRIKFILDGRDCYDPSDFAKKMPMALAVEWLLVAVDRAIYQGSWRG